MIVSAETDFGAILAATGASGPSLLLVRRSSLRRSAELLQLILTNLPELFEALQSGSIVVLEDDRIRIRALPLLF